MELLHHEAAGGGINDERYFSRGSVVCRNFTIRRQPPLLVPETFYFQNKCIAREGDPKGWSTVLITALGSWEKSVPRAHTLQ